VRKLFERVIVPLHAIACGCTFNPRGVDVDPNSQPNSYECSCQCADQTLSLTDAPAASADDAEEIGGSSGGAVLLAGQVLDLTTDPNTGNPQVIGLRFPNLGLPRDAVIVSAQVQFTVSEATSDATHLTFHGEAADDAAAYTATNGDVSGRGLTAASVDWAVPAWTTAGEAGAAELTPDLGPLLQEIVARPGWAPGHAAAIVISGTGLRRAVSFDADPQGAPKLLVQYLEPSIAVDLHVCVPDALNPNLGGATPAADDLAADCSNRVESTVHGLTLACGYPSVCDCTATADTSRFAAVCNAGCAEVPLAADCSNFDPSAGVVTATNAPGQDPVCTTGSPLTAEMFGQISRCEVSGQATVAISDLDTKHPDATGVLEFSGRPCPGGTCDVGLSYRFDVDPVHYESLFSSATFEDLAALGESAPGAATVDATGAGVFAPDTTDVSGRGRRGSQSRAVVGSNSDDVDVTVDWAAATCSLSGALVGNVDPELKRCEAAGPDAGEVCATDDDCADDAACSDGTCDCLPVPPVDMTLSMTVGGSIVNQPPTAAAGADPVVECNQAGGAAFTLDGAGSHDPDGDLAAFRWFRDSRVGPTLGFQPRVGVTQALGTVAYVLRVIDTYGQADEDTTVATVRDTTPPVLECNAPPTISPPDAPITFTATATDVCDPDVAAHVDGFTCYEIKKNGKRIDKTGSCVVRVDGARLTVRDSGGVNDHIAWTISATDASGNPSAAACEVVVVRKR
jgi:hypothetical protein